MLNKRIIVIVFMVVLILLIPLIAMQFIDEVNWTFFDFLVAGALLISTGLLCEIIFRKVRKVKHRIVICLVILFTLIFLWVELAVGIIGTPFSGT